MKSFKLMILMVLVLTVSACSFEQEYSNKDLVENIQLYEQALLSQKELLKVETDPARIAFRNKNIELLEKDLKIAKEIAKERDLYIKKEEAQAKIDLIKKKNERLLAEADYQIKLTKAKAIRDSNKIIGEGITDSLLKLRSLEVQEVMAHNKMAVFMPYEAFGSVGAQTRMYK